MTSSKPSGVPESVMLEFARAFDLASMGDHTVRSQHKSTFGGISKKKKNLQKKEIYQYRRIICTNKVTRN